MTEADSEPEPEPESVARVAALVLAAGRSSRMAGQNKLLADFAGAPLIASVVDQVSGSAAARVVVVTGHQADALRAALAGRQVEFVHNPEFANGLASSLRAGLRAVMGACDGVVVCLGDMPRVRAGHVDSLIAAFVEGGAREVCVPVHAGRRGNPVLWPARCFAALLQLEGDTGGRALLATVDGVRSVTVDDDGVLADADTEQALAALRGGC